MQWLYLIAAILGTVLPLSYFIPFLLAHGLDVPLFFRQLFQNQVSSFFGMDVLVSSLVLWLLVFSEGKRRGMKKLVGLCPLQSAGRRIFGFATVPLLSRA
jgi:hypothetical protein